MFVYRFEKARGSDKFPLGGKGRDLLQKKSRGSPVPPRLLVTPGACRGYLRTGQVPSGPRGELKSNTTEPVKRSSGFIEEHDGPRRLNPAGFGDA